jgi:hypothetical protein
MRLSPTPVRVEHPDHVLDDYSRPSAGGDPAQRLHADLRDIDARVALELLMQRIRDLESNLSHDLAPFVRRTTDESAERDKKTPRPASDERFASRGTTRLIAP